jgi:DHA3 family macrolide efflux protein-like MFS transporter
VTGLATDPDQGRRSVRLLAAARLASTGGSQAAQLALAYTIYQRTSSAAWVSASLVASAGVVGLVGPLSGRLSDRHDRRRVMVAAELAGGAGWLAVLAAGSPTMLVAAALVATAANAPFRAASSASIPNLVAPDQLTWANGVIATASNASLVAGPLVGGVLVGAVGPRAVFGLNVVSFLVSGALIARMPGRFAEDRAPGEGAPTQRWRTVLGDRCRRRLFAVTALSFGAFGVTLVADLPLVDHFGGGSVGYALLTSLWGTGAVVGSLAATRLTVRHERRALVGGTAAMGVSLASIAVMPNLASAIVVGTLGGLGAGLAFTQWYSLLQRASPDAERGTTFAIAETSEQVSFVAGMVVAGFVVDALGPQPTYLLPGALLLAATAVSCLVTVTATAPTPPEPPPEGDQAPARMEAT